MTTKTQPDASAMIETTVDNLRIDAAYLNMNSRDQADAEAARVLATASLKIRRLSDALERMKRTITRRGATGELVL
jgi:head-tail adaptor